MKTSAIAPAVLACLMSVALTYAGPIPESYELEARDVVDSAIDALYMRDLEAEIFNLQARQYGSQSGNGQDQITIDYGNGKLPGGQDKITLDVDEFGRPRHPGNHKAEQNHRGTGSSTDHKGARVDKKVKPTGTRGANVRPTGTRGANVRPTGTRGANVRPTSTRGANVKPTGTRGLNVKPTGTRASNARPTGTGISKKGQRLAGSPASTASKSSKTGTRRPGQQRKHGQGQGGNGQQDFTIDLGNQGGYSQDQINIDI